MGSSTRGAASLAAAGRRLLSSRAAAAAAAPSGAAATAGRAIRVQPYDDVPLLERAPRPAAPAARLFTRTPIGEHSEADARRYYELPTEQIERCFPEGFNPGVAREFAATNLPALMVRPSALAARRALDALAADAGALRSASALVLGGPRGAGKSATLAYLVHAARSSGWLVLHVPSAHGYLNGQARFSPLSALRIEIGIVCAAEAEASSGSASAASLERLFDVAAATSALLRGFLAAHEPLLGTLPVQRAETRALAAALNVQLGSLADLVQLGTPVDASGLPTEVCSHALVALLRELQLVTRAPVLLAIDDANAFDRGTAFRDPQSAFPIDASRFLLPALLGSAAAAGAGLQRGLVLAANSHSLSYRPHEPARRRKRREQAERVRAPWADAGAPRAAAGAPAAGAALPLVLEVPAYDDGELQAALSAYAHTAAWLPPDAVRASLGRAEKSGSAEPGHLDGVARQMHLLTASRGDLVRKFCTKLA